MRFILLFLLVSFCGNLIAQENNVYYTFNDCMGTDSGTFGVDALIDGVPDCNCGVDANGLSLDGNNDRIQIPDTVESFFDDDFTIDFYFSVENTTGLVNLFSYRSTCDKDSSLAVIYVVETNTLRVELAESFTNIFELMGQLDLSKCIHGITITKFNLTYSLYIDGMLVDREEAIRQIPFGRNADAWVANSPCIVFTEDRLEGTIDELFISNFALTDAEIASNYFAPDRIITETTTLFKDEVIRIETGPTCANTVTWTPDLGLDDATVKDPILTAVETTDYAVAFNNGACISRDTIRINVVDENTLQCSDLLLPKAFTPNNDGTNDVYGISNEFLVDELEKFEIFDRTGALVFASSTLGETWDGSFKSKPVMPGVYVYKIAYTCNNEEFLKVDNFTVLR